MQCGPCPGYVYSLPTGDVPIHRCCRECGIILHALLCRKVRTPEPDPRPHCRLHHLLQHGGVLLCCGGLASWASGWGEYNIGLYGMPRWHVCGGQPLSVDGGQHGLHALPCRVHHRQRLEHRGYGVLSLCSGQVSSRAFLSVLHRYSRGLHCK